MPSQYWQSDCNQQVCLALSAHVALILRIRLKIPGIFAGALVMNDLRLEENSLLRILNCVTFKSFGLGHILASLLSISLL